MEPIPATAIMENAENTADLLTTREAADVLAVSPMTVRRLVGRGLLPCVQLSPGSPLRFRDDDVALLARLSRRTAA